MSETEQQWTKNVPTEKGYYWVHDPSRKRIKTALIWFENEGMIRIFGGAWLDVRNFKGAFYYGPLSMPSEPQQENSSEA